MTAQTCAFAQQTVFENLPPTTNGSTQFRAPSGKTDNTTLRTHFIIPASEITTISNGTTFTQIGFNYLDGVLTAASGTIQLYLENTSDATNLKSATWTTAISTMTSVYSGAMVLPVGTAATTLDFTLSTPFTYTGGGLYVAYDYLGSVFDTDAATYPANFQLTNSLKSYATVSTTPAATLTSTSAFRPQMRFGYANSYNNDVSVEKVNAYGHTNPLLPSSQTVTATIKNTSVVTLTNIPVTLTVTGANAATNTQNIASLASGASQDVTFTGLTYTNVGSQDLTVTVPNDDLNTNNSTSKNQIISCDTLAFNNNAAANSSVGFNTNAGILAAKYQTSSNFPLEINGISIGIDGDPANSLNSVKAVVLNAAGDIIDSSAAFSITTGDLGTIHNFTLLGSTIIPANTSFYVGLRQTANATTGYFPVSTQLPDVAPADLFFTFPEYGGTPGSGITDLGVFMIEAIVNPSVTITQNNVTLTANITGVSYQWYDCINQNIITSATSQTYIATANGDYKVIVATSCGVDSSDCVTVSSVGMNENEPLTNLEIYPSPVNETLFINLKGMVITQISIYDVNNKLISSNLASDEKTTINVRMLESGVYFLKVDSEKGSITQRFVKN